MFVWCVFDSLHCFSKDVRSKKIRCRAFCESQVCASTKSGSDVWQRISVFSCYTWEAQVPRCERAHPQVGTPELEEAAQYLIARAYELKNIAERDRPDLLVEVSIVPAHSLPLCLPSSYCASVQSSWASETLCSSFNQRAFMR